MSRRFAPKFLHAAVCCNCCSLVAPADLSMHPIFNQNSASRARRKQLEMSDWGQKSGRVMLKARFRELEGSCKKKEARGFEQ